MGAYRTTLESHARRVLPAEAEVAVSGLPAGSYRGRAPTAALSNAFAHHRILDPVLDNALAAERDGYDAFIIGSFSEPYLRELRAAVDIPVVSVVEATLLVACSIGKHVGLIANAPAIARIVGESVKRHGLAERAQAPRWIEPPLDEFEMARAFDAPASVAAKFEDCARKAIADSADVIIPAEGVLSELLYRNGTRSIDGVPVLDSFGVAWNYAAMLVGLRARTGLAVSRGWYYHRGDPELVRALAKPPDMAADVLAGLTDSSATNARGPA